MKKGEKMSDELRQKLSELALIRCDTKEFREKMSVIGFQRVYKHPTHCRRGHEFTPKTPISINGDIIPAWHAPIV